MKRIKYLSIEVAIHGLDADADAHKFLCGWLKEATVAALRGHCAAKFRYRDEFEDDVEVSVTESVTVPMPRAKKSSPSP